MKTILVPYHDDAAADAAMPVATTLTRRVGGYLEGLLVRATPHLGLGANRMVPPEYLSEATRIWREFADSARTRFLRLVKEAELEPGELETESPGALAGWREVEGDEASVLGEYGRLFDLIVLGRSANGSETSWQSVCESALFETGRPVAIAGSQSVTASFGERVMVAWNGSTETARTVALAMPLLQGARQVIVLTVEGGMLGGPAGRDLAAHLHRNGVAAEAVTIEPEGRTVGEAIIEEALEREVSLLVKGAYTRSRLRQIVFGGVTQHILSYAPMPVLMAH